MRNCATLSLLAVWTSVSLWAISGGAAEVQFNRDVRPILSEYCFRCHGADAATRESDLRLDQSADVTIDRGGYRVIKAGDSSASELVARITSKEDDVQMPPLDSGQRLSNAEIKILRQWIDEGAKYQSHWSFLPLRRPSLPSTRNAEWPRGAIDYFVLSRIEKEGIAPTVEADAAMLIRRVSLSLTGLPPTIDEIESFERDYACDSNQTYLRLVDRLLASPRFGERMAQGWLDVARYADTNGYFTDKERTMWPWRDWVINALNQNMPFDRFTIEQLAGDLLPKSTVAQRVATGFNRNHMINNETGIIEEEFRVEYVADRVDTTATVWMGLTVGCARCHDHKYDPISQQDYYRFFAFFNNVPERGLSGSQGNSTPLLKIPNETQRMQLDIIAGQLERAKREYATIEPLLAEEQLRWESSLSRDQEPFEPNQLVAHFKLDSKESFDNVPDEISFQGGMIDKAAKFEGNAAISVADAFQVKCDDAFSLGAWIKPNGSGCVISKVDDARDMRGFDIVIRKSKVVVNLVNQFNRNAIRVSTLSKISNRQWQHVMVTYDGSSRASGIQIFIDGHPQPVEIEQDSLTATIQNDQPLRIGRRQASASYTGAIDDVRFYGRELNRDEVDRFVTDQLVRGIVAIPESQRSAAQKNKLRAVFLATQADPVHAMAAGKVDQLRQRQRKLTDGIATTMVMEESDQPREAYVLLRGQYDQHGQQVSPGVPKFLSTTPMPATKPNRLAMAKWLVDPSHPLTARVTVNRIWRHLFGRGIVKTADDFGTQGELPSHPDLLDWMAVELIESGWDVKRLVRLIVSSATFRQTSQSSPERFESDRENRLLARGPRIRMSAEMVRDNALAISGLLVEKLGGPSVMPYQPAGVWADVTYDGELDYRSGIGESLYRRSLYTYWKRQAPPPNMLVFDAPTRETCVVQRSRTNTPLQALALMNDPTFVEASRVLALRVMKEKLESDRERVSFAFQSATARRPSNDETSVLLDIFRRQRAWFRRSEVAAMKLLSVGQSPLDQTLNVADLAAWTTVANTVLCLDETISRP